MLSKEGNDLLHRKIWGQIILFWAMCMISYLAYIGSEGIRSTISEGMMWLLWAIYFGDGAMRLWWTFKGGKAPQLTVEPEKTEQK